MKSEKKETRINLFPVFEHMFGISKINSKEKLNALIAELRENPDEVISFEKLIEK